MPAGSPLFTDTMMLAIVLPEPSTSISLATGVVCLDAHAGSASMASGFRLGTLPSYVTVPVMVAPANADVAVRRSAARARLRPKHFREHPRKHPRLIRHVILLLRRVEGCGSDVFERERFREARIPERHQCAATRHPSEGGEDDAAHRAERGEVGCSEANAFGMQHRHHAPVQVEEVHQQLPDRHQDERPGTTFHRPGHQEEKGNQKMSDGEKHARRLPRPHLPLHVVDRLLRYVRIPDEEILREGNVGQKMVKPKRSFATSCRCSTVTTPRSAPWA